MWRAIDDQMGEAQALDELGNIVMGFGEHERARALLQQSLALRRKIGDRPGTAAALSALAHVMLPLGHDYGKAVRMCEECLGIRRPLGDKWGIAWGFTNMALALWKQGKPGRAEACFGEALALRRQMGDKIGTASSLMMLAILGFERGDREAGLRMLAEGLELHLQLGNRLGAGHCLGIFGRFAHAQGHHRRAARLLGAAEAVRGALAAARSPHQDQCASAVHSALGNEMFSEAWGEGRRMTLDEAAAYAVKDGPDEGGSVTEPDP
jgi:tetratricopeptide (TPR) repeat protein